MYGLLSWLIFGLVAGLLAKALMPGRDPGGTIATILLGIAGAFAGGWLGRAAGFYGPNEPAGLVMAVVGSLVLLFGYRMMRMKSI